MPIYNGDILFLCQFFYPEYVSSATLPWDTALILSQNGYKVEALCGYPKEYINKKESLCKEVQSVKIKRIRYLELNRRFSIGRLINYFSFTVSCAFNIFKLRGFKSVIVYSNPPILPIVAVMGKKLFKNKLVYVCYDVYPEIAQITNSIKKGGLISKVMHYINKILYKNTDKVIALSTEMKKFLIKNREISKKNIEVIPNWYEDIKVKEDINCNNKELKTIKGEQDFIISYFGNMGVCQDMETVVNTIKRNENPNIKFLFAGHGKETNNIKAAIKDGILKNTYFFDFLHGEDYRYALQISDCFIISLKNGLSGLCVPSKTYSYMAAGKPIICIMDKNTDISRDILTEGAGAVFDNNQCEEILTFINTIMNDRKIHCQMSKKCKKLFEDKYTKQACLNKYINMFQTFINKND